MKSTMRMSFIFSAVLAVVAIGMAVFAAEGSSSPYSDAIGDTYTSGTTDPVIGTNANGTLDIVGMEVSNTPTDITFKLTVNGNIGTTDWAKYMIGIATGKTDGTQSGNGWGRPINLSYDNDPFATSLLGMNYWVGSWIDSGGGSEVYSYNNGSSTWARLGATWDAGTYPYPYIRTPGAQSTVEWSFPLSLLDLSEGDTFYFDVYTSGGGGGDSAVDSLANPNITTELWAGPYTSYATAAGGPGLNSYTVAAIPEPSTMAMASGAAVAGVVIMLRRRRRAA